MKVKNILTVIMLLAAMMLLLSGCGSKGQIMDGDGMLNTYKQISQDEAKEMMLRLDGHVILDVRRQDEYDAGHIPGAVNVPLSMIDRITRPKDAPLFLYCLRGTRSKRAAGILKKMGYTVKSIGGISGYQGETER